VTASKQSLLYDRHLPIQRPAGTLAITVDDRLCHDAMQVHGMIPVHRFVKWISEETGS
jgi:hypothetical protein